MPRSSDGEQCGIGTVCISILVWAFFYAPGQTQFEDYFKGGDHSVVGNGFSIYATMLSRLLFTPFRP
jgi:nitrogen fixation-related uncharacterized protein